MEFVLTDAYKELGVDWVKLDPSRVLQVSFGIVTTNKRLICTPGTHQSYYERNQVHHNRDQSHNQSDPISVQKATFILSVAYGQFLSVEVQARRAYSWARLG